MKIRTQLNKALAKSADFVATVPTRTRNAVASGRRLTKGAGKVAARAEVLVDAQLDTLEVAAALSAKRLQAASEAESLGTLVQGQVALFPETKAAALSEARKYVEMFFAAKGEVDATLKAKVLAWVAPKTPKARKAPATVAAAA